MPTLADLQALRDKQNAPDPGIKLDAPGAAKTPTLADLQALRDKKAPESKPPAEKLTLGGAIMDDAGTIGRGVLNKAKELGTGLVNTMSAPGRVLSGDLKVDSPEGREAAMDVAGFVAGGAAGKQFKAAPKSSEFSDAAKTLNMNFSKAKSAEDVAAEINRAGQAHAERTNHWIWDRAPPDTPTEKINPVGQSAVNTFSSRKQAESKFWQAQETMGNTIAHDAAEQVKDLHALREKTLAGADATNPEIQKSVAAIDRALAELGSPYQKPQSVVEHVTEKGGVMRRTEGLPEYAPDATRTLDTTKEVDPTITRGDKRVTAVTQDPVNSQTVRAGTARTTTTDPYTVTKRIIKGEAPKGPRASNVGDLVRASRALNEDTYRNADKTLMKEIKNIVDSPLGDVAKNNKNFGKARVKALQQTQKNADIYRTDATMKKLGFDEDTLREVRYAQKSGRDIGTDTLERISKGVDTVDTPQKLLAARRTLDKPTFSMFLRAKNAAIRADAGMDYDKLLKARPMLEEIYKYSRVPAAKAKKELDALLVSAKEMQRYGIPSNPQVAPKIKGVPKMAAIKNAVFSAAMGRGGQVGYHALSSLVPSAPNATAQSLKAFGKAATPKQPRNLLGPSVGAVLGANMGSQVEDR